MKMTKIKKILCFGLTLALMLSLSVGFTAVADSPTVKYEAEDGILHGSGLTVATDLSGYSGSGYVGKFTSSSEYLEIPISVSESGRYDITVRTNCSNNYKENNCSIDGTTVGTLYSYAQNGWQDFTFEAVNLTAGDHKFKIEKSWGWICVDYITVTKGDGIPNSIYDVSYSLANPNANDDAKRLWQYLCDNYGTNIISGQYNDKGPYSGEYTAIKNATGDAPAIWGFDMMEYSPSRTRLNGNKPHSVDYAIDWAKEYGGIVSFCWHWTPNEAYLFGNTSGKEWWRGFYKDSTTYDIKAVMNGEDEAGYQYLLEDIDAIAVQLGRLQDEGIPVLWRPLHEASGGWFWWGTDRDSCVELWKLMYDRLTNYHKLNNLIWVWNGQAADWYPGDEYVDIIGEDIYPNKGDTSSQMARFLKAKNYTNPSKMICLSENGTMPDIDNCIEDNAMWSWFATWGGEFIQSNSSLSGTYTPVETIKKVFASENVITLSEVPDISTYPIGGYEYTEGDGDINSDGILDIVDIVLTRSHIVGNSELTEAQLIKGDMNKDSNVDIVDIVLMRKVVISSK